MDRVDPTSSGIVALFESVRPKRSRIVSIYVTTVALNDRRSVRD